MDKNVSTSTVEFMTDEQISDNFNEDYLDILGNRQILKKILVEGRVDDKKYRPQTGQIVCIEYENRLFKDCNSLYCDAQILEKTKKIQFVVGDGDVIQGLDLAIRHAYLDEEFELFVHPRFGYGSEPFEDIPANAHLLFYIKLLKISTAPPLEDLTDEQRIAQSELKRERGNFLYKRNDFVMAINSYTKAMQILEANYTSRAVLQQEKPELFKVLLIVLNNVAAAQIKSCNYSGALEACQLILQNDSKNPKALYRMGLAQIELGDYSEAIKHLSIANRLYPNSAHIQTALAQSRNLLVEKQSEDKSFYQKMFPEAFQKSVAPTRSKFQIYKKIFIPLIGVLVVILSLYAGVYITQIEQEMIDKKTPA